MFGDLPIGIKGEFGPCARSLVCTLKHVGNMSEPKIAELLENCGIFISQSTISRILTNDETGFNKEKDNIFLAALASTPYHQVDDTTVRNGDEITSATMHHSFRPPLSDLKSQKS